MLSIKDLTKAEIDQAENLLVQLLKDSYPSLDLSRGRVLRDILIRPAALFYAYASDNMDRLRRSMSLQQISQDPTLADDTIVSGVLSNLLLERDAGSVADGSLRIIISSNVVTPIDAGAKFFANGLTFVTTRAFVGVTSAGNVVNDSSRLIVARSDNTYEFIIDVEAEAIGSEYNVAEGTRFTTDETIPRLVDIWAASDFINGRPGDDNATLAAKAQLGLAPKVMSGRVHIESFIKSKFPNVRAVSIIGFGDPEMRRDAHNIFNVSQGGKVDIYVRSEYAPVKEMITVAGALTDTVNKIFTINLTRDQAAGVYVILGVYKSGETPFVDSTNSEPTFVDSLGIENVTWSYNNVASNGEFVPDITNNAEAAFTRYSTVSIQVIEEGTALTTINDTAEFDIYVLRMPDIAAIQDSINERSVRNPAGDYLVKAPIPAMCNIGIEVVTKDIGNVDVAAIKNAVANRVNSLGFTTGNLPASVIVDAAQGQLDKQAIINMPISMLAKITLPSGATKIVSGTDELEIPKTMEESVSTRTVAFFVRPSDIDVAVTKANTPEV